MAVLGAITGVLFLAVYLAGGVFAVRCLVPGKSPVIRAWLGVCLGILLMMWLPFLSAFLFRFTLTAHVFSLVPLAMLLFLCWRFRGKETPRPFGKEDQSLLRLILLIALPLTLVGAYLQWTHNINPAPDGSLHVGQSTYGDLNLHLSIITSMRGAAVPMDYSIYPGERLCYPFLTDTFSTSFMLFGSSLRFAVVFPGILMMALTFSGYLILARRIAVQSRVAALAALLFFINGGLGFIYSFDMIGVGLGMPGENELKSGNGILERLNTILNGWYQTPANHTEFTTYNLRWSNVIADMLIPQRTILGGWCMLLPCLYLLFDIGSSGRFDDPDENSVPPELMVIPGHVRTDRRALLLLAVWAGALPLVHTHCFLALGLISFGWMVWDTWDRMSNRGERVYAWLLYGFTAVLLALPQLIGFTFKQTASSDHFLTFQFNWVNNSGNAGMRDMYLWFYLKNIGIPFLLILLALFEKDRKTRFLAVGAFCIFIPAELIRFQPNEYDNNKLFYVWYMLCAVIAADYAFRIYDRLKGLRSRCVIAVISVFVFFCTGTLSIARECVSDYQTFSKEEVEAAEWIEQNTDREDRFLTWTEHINPVSSLCGRSIVCGPSFWLYWHGFNITSRENEIRSYLSDPEGNPDILRKYNVKYIYTGTWENNDLYVNHSALQDLCEMVYEGKNEWGTTVIRIYRVPDPERGE